MSNTLDKRILAALRERKKPLTAEQICQDLLREHGIVPSQTKVLLSLRRLEDTALLTSRLKSRALYAYMSVPPTRHAA